MSTILVNMMTSKQRNATAIWFKITVFFPCLFICFSSASAGDVRPEPSNSGGMGFEVVTKELVNIWRIECSNMKDSSINAGDSRGKGGNKFGGSRNKGLSFVSKQHETVHGYYSKKAYNNSNGPRYIFTEDIAHAFPLFVIALYLVAQRRSSAGAFFCGPLEEHVMYSKLLFFLDKLRN